MIDKDTDEMIKGIGTSNGIGIGYALLIENNVFHVKTTSEINIQKEKDRFIQVKQAFIEETENMVEKLQNKLGEQDKTALVLKNQIYLINDEELCKEVIRLIENKHICVEMAIEETCQFFAGMFVSMNSELMSQRVADIEDLKNRVLRLLSGGKQVDLSQLEPDTVIVANQLHPSVTAVMDTAHVVGIIAQNGGDTSHAAILARALEIPAVLSVKNATELIKTGDLLIVDGQYGEVFVNPIPKTIQIFENRRARYKEKVKELRKYINKKTKTADGSSVGLMANIGNEDEAAKAIKSGAEGVGLFRTEFLFMNGKSMPTQEQQFEVYKKAAVLCGDKPLTIRTLDIGGDKDIPYMGLTREANPFLGYRAIRFCLGRIDIFTTQLKAILQASAYGNIRIMLPLITTIDEVIIGKKIIYDTMKELDKDNINYNKNIKIGMMIETPAASLIADVLVKEADFFSIGTNDLTQYILAVDRGNEHVSYLYSVFNPAVLRAIKHVISCAKKEHIEVGMCGEAAANPSMIPLLLAFGLDEFSVSAAKVLETRKNIALWKSKEAQQIADKVLLMNTEKEITTYLNKVIFDKNSAMNMEQ